MFFHVMKTKSRPQLPLMTQTLGNCHSPLKSYKDPRVTRLNIFLIIKVAPPWPGVWSNLVLRTLLREIVLYP